MGLVAAWKFSIMFLVIIPLMITSSLILVVVIKRNTIKENQAYGIAGKIAEEALSSIRTVAALGMEKSFINSFRQNLRGVEKIGIRKGILSGFFSGLSILFFNASFGIGILLATYLARTDCENYTAANLMQAFFCMTNCTFAFSMALPFVKDMIESRMAGKKIFEIIDSSTLNVSKKGGKKLINLNGDIEFNNVQFSYPQRKEVQVLKGMDLTVPAGRTIAIVGPRFVTHSILYDGYFKKDF